MLNFTLMTCNFHTFLIITLNPRDSARTSRISCIYPRTPLTCVPPMREPGAQETRQILPGAKFTGKSCRPTRPLPSRDVNLSAFLSLAWLIIDQHLRSFSFRFRTKAPPQLNLF